MVFLLCWSASAAAAELQGVVADASTGEVLAARIYIVGSDGVWHFVSSADQAGSAVRYDKINWINRDSVEKHTTVSASPWSAQLPAGHYLVTVERGKEYFPESREIDIGTDDASVRIELRRWADMGADGWWSGETHLHRTLEETANVVVAEDLNVAMPLTYWVTKSGTPPASGDKNVAGDIPDQLIEVDATHVIWPRNTEYEIFSVGEQRHTLGALFVLNHRSVLGDGVPPWASVARKARQEGALLDMDKLDWPFAMSLPVSTGAQLYELANNHLWRTSFAFEDWNTRAPGFLLPPFGGSRGGEREWLMYTLGMYYVLLDAGFKLVPTAGTANGVHPVPAGFGRVYVKLDGEFSYAKWLEGLAAGRSFVTTGPMLTVTANGEQAGAGFRSGGAPLTVDLQGEVISERPLSMIEVVVNGSPVKLLTPSNRATEAGALRTAIGIQIEIAESGWVCLRCFEEREDGRLRFAHTAPWWIAVDGKPLRPREEEKAYLVRRVEEEIARSRGIVGEAGMAEYEAALTYYRSLETRPEDLGEARAPAGDGGLKQWLENMVGWHGFTPHEVRAATGMSLEEVERELRAAGIEQGSRPGAADGLTVMPYPGGRHPRIGFLDGALAPQRETKLSVFPPWEGGGYVVVDLPEALWSNLGLTYLGHSHIPTVWDARGERLPRQEWRREASGAFLTERKLPNGVEFGARAEAVDNDLRMELWVKNGSEAALTGLRAQVCAMLKGMPAFNAQTGMNKLLSGDAAAVHDGSGERWIVLAWTPCHRAWQNPPVPCLHSDPKFRNCAPGETVRAMGLMRFYEGADIEREISRIMASDWLKD